MQNVAVYFDTNAYRVLTFGLTEEGTKELFDRIKAVEQARNIVPYANVIVLAELLTHLADSTDSGYHHCKIATIGAMHHVYEGSSNNIRLLPDPELSLQHMLFNQTNAQQADANRSYAGVAYDIYREPTDDNIAKLKPALQNISHVVGRHERDFVTDMRDAILQLDPNASDWKLFKDNKVKRQEFIEHLKTDDGLLLLAYAFVQRAMRTLPAKSVTFEGFMERGKMVAEAFKSALTLYLKMMERMANPKGGYDMTHPKKKRWNTVWDVYLLFSLPDGDIDGKQTVFVTNEDWLHEVAAATGMGNRVLKSTDYKAMLGI